MVKQKTKMGKRMDEDSLRTLLMSPQDAKTSDKRNQVSEKAEKTLYTDDSIYYIDPSKCYPIGTYPAIGAIRILMDEGISQ